MEDLRVQRTYLLLKNDLLELLDKNSFILIFSFLNSFSNNSDPFSIFSSFFVF